MEIFTDLGSKFLYHFTTREKLIEFILPGLKLKLSFLRNMNDPKEKLMHINHYFSGVEFAGEVIELSKELNDMVDKYYKLCCFSSDYIVDSEAFEGYNLPRMWATYGGNHQGVCLVIDKEIFRSENLVDDNINYLRCVSYTSNSNNYILLKDNILSMKNYIPFSERLKNCIDQIFFEKNVNWLTEHEVRFLTTNLNKDYALIANSLNKIILGMEFNNLYKPLIHHQIARHGKTKQIQISQISFNSMNGELFLQ